MRSDRSVRSAYIRHSPRETIPPFTSSLSLPLLSRAHRYAHPSPTSTAPLHCRTTVTEDLLAVEEHIFTAPRRRSARRHQVRVRWALNPISLFEFILCRLDLSFLGFL